ncbi:hypothetical protein ACWCXB_29890 [Streptomyces sp. NPDC001514]
MRSLYEKVGDADDMPADGELYAALVWAERNVSRLREATDEVRRVAALKRVQLWQYLREQIDRHQLQAVDDARAAGAEWAQLVAPLAVRAPSAAYNKTQRMRAVSLSDGSLEKRSVRRTPEAVALAQQRLAAAEQAERRREEKARRRHDLTVRVAQKLLDHRAELVQDEEVSDWLDNVEAVLPGCRTPTQQVSLATYVAAAARTLRQIEQRTARPVAATEDARLAVEAAAALYPDT